MVPSNPNMIRANPLLETYRTSFVVLFMLFGLFFLLLIFVIVINVILGFGLAGLTKSLSSMSFYIPTVLYITLAFVLTISQWRYWQRIERRRLAAAARDPSLLAVEQPLANPAALQLPCTITLRRSKETIEVLMAMALLFALLLAGAFSWLDNGFLFISPDRFHNFLILFAITAAVMAIILLAIFLSPMGRQKIEVTEQGLSARYGGQKGAVRWEAARLFAMYNTWGAQKNGSSLTYELSSATDIARWTWVLRPNLLHLNMIPTVPSNDYNRQMQALNALIVARTGLPLSDLRTDSASSSQRNLAPYPSRRNM